MYEAILFMLSHVNLVFLLHALYQDNPRTEVLCVILPLLLLFSFRRWGGSIWLPVAIYFSCCMVHPPDLISNHWLMETILWVDMVKPNQTWQHVMFPTCSLCLQAAISSYHNTKQPRVVSAMMDGSCTLTLITWVTTTQLLVVLLLLLCAETYDSLNSASCRSVTNGKLRSVFAGSCILLLLIWFVVWFKQLNWGLGWRHNSSSSLRVPYFEPALWWTHHLGN